MLRRTFIPSIIVAVLAAFTFNSCDKVAIPKEVTGLADVLKGATSSLQGIADVDPSEAVAKAKEALPQLQNTGEQLSAVNGLMDKLPGPAKDMVTKALEQFGPKIQELIGKISGIPGVSGAIQPALDKITSSLSALKG